MQEKRNFGFTSITDRQIDFDRNDHGFYAAVAGKEPSVRNCISCGTCASACSAAQFTEFSLRRIILLVRRGETGTLNKEISGCMLCGKCQLVCPRGVNTRNLILQIRLRLSELTVAGNPVEKRKPIPL